MASLTRDDILAALSGVIDRATQTDVVSSGQIQGLVVRDGHVGFSIEVPAARGGAMEPLRRDCEAAVRKLKGVLSVTAVLTAHHAQPGSAAAMPQSAHDHDHDHNHVHGKPPARPAPKRSGPLNIPGIAAIVAVASGKGGVGKSTMAVNIALGLSHLGLRVGLLDADIYGPSIPRMLGLKGKPEVEGKKLQPMESFGIKCMSIGFLVDEETAMIWRGPMVQSALTQMMTDVAWGELDVLIVDFPPGTGDAQLTMVQRVPLAGAIIVSTPQDIALIDARKGYAMFEKTHVPVFGIIENMSYFISPGSGEKSYIFGQGGARRMAEKLGCDFLGEVPLHMSVRETSDAGTPIVASAPDSDEARTFVAIAAKVAAHIKAAASARARKAPKIVIED